MPLSLGKSIELKKLMDANVPVPKTVFGRMDKLPYPFVVKSTSSQRGREVWKVDNGSMMKDLRSRMDKNKFVMNLCCNLDRLYTACIFI